LDRVVVSSELESRVPWWARAIVRETVWRLVMDRRFEIGAIARWPEGGDPDLVPDGEGP
jgi:hypothetical protein